MIATALLLMTADLQTKDLKVGTGPGAVAGDYVVVDYTGKLTNGKKFDSSIGREPFGFLLGGGQVIKGWDLGVAGMKKGGKRLLTIPAELGYGDRGAGKDIPGGATLVFEVELKKIVRVAIEPVKEGTGYAAKFGDSVELHYVGTLTDGKKFDSSRDRSEPFLVTIGSGVIPGFSQGLLGIKSGEVRKVTIPAELAYGKRAVGGVIPANSDLVFELEALKIIPAKD